MKQSVLSIDAATYASHPLHASDRAWPETNCYVDLWIELLHTMQLDPTALMAFALFPDFEGDQWTFFKPSPSDLRDLYSIDVQELTIWRPVAQHVREQIELGRVVLVEVDAFFLPDTTGVSYAIEHTKTTIAAESVDVDAHELGYFHNAGYFTLGGADFEGIFNQGAAPALAPYTEIAKIARATRLDAAELRARARTCVVSHLARRPADNPVRRFGERVARDIERLSSEAITEFHKYAFATLRQLGASAELSSSFLEWLDDDTGEAAATYRAIADCTKAMQFQIARAVSRRRALDIDGSIADIARAWDVAMSAIARRYEG